ncbi:MAG: hypothetical protein A2V75_00740 [Actinobacteria bacterium RBG_16_70_17]|nr:MAG: hypothetical protein A2V75_00740 [Actinobacteria bacterium RBG_16_70_17]
MQVGPVHHRPHEGEPPGDQGDVAQGAESPAPATHLQAEGHSQVTDLALQGAQVLPDDAMQVLPGTALAETGVGHHHACPHGPPQLQGVLERRPGAGGLLLVVEGQHCEVGGVDGEGDPPLAGQLPEAPAARLLPGEALDEGQFVGAMTPPRQPAEEGGVIPILGGEAGGAEGDHGASMLLGGPS